MTSFIQGLSRRSIVAFFGTLYAVALAFALFPPLYLWGSGSRFDILGIPFAIMYWVIDALVLGGLTLTAFYVSKTSAASSTTTRPNPLAESLGG